MKVQKAYQSGKKPVQKKQTNPVRNEQKVKNVIDKINLKIDDLNLNL